MFKYIPVVDTKEGSDLEALAANRHALADGVRGVECVGAGYCTYGELIDYTPFAPWGTHLSSVERYANGAKNFFVKNGSDVLVGYLIVRSH